MSTHVCFALLEARPLVSAFVEGRLGIGDDTVVFIGVRGVVVAVH